jgi:hypothetical protein
VERPTRWPATAEKDSSGGEASLGKWWLTEGSTTLGGDSDGY